MWKISGVLIIAASISSVHLYAFDYKAKDTIKKQVFRIGTDIGSYLSIMQMIKEPVMLEEQTEDDFEKITILVGTTKGYFEQFKLSLEFELSDYGEANMLGDIGFGGGGGGGGGRGFQGVKELKEELEVSEDDVSAEEMVYTGSNKNKNKRFLY